MGLLDRAIKMKSASGAAAARGLRARAARVRTNVASSGSAGKGLLARAAGFREKKKVFPASGMPPVAAASDQQISRELPSDDINAVRDALDRKVLDLTNLFEISKEINGTLNQETLLSTLLFSAMGQMGVQKIAVCSRSGDGVFRMAAQKGLDSIPPEKVVFSGEGTLAGSFAGSDRPVEADAVSGNLSAEEADALQISGAVLIAPLVNKDDLVGFLLLGERYGGIPFADDDKEFLATLASMAAISMENARLYSRLEQKLNQLSALYEISRIINSSEVLDQVLDLVGETLGTGFHLSMGALYLNEETGFRLSRTYGFAQDQAVRTLLSPDHPEFSAVLTMGEAADFPDYSTRESLNTLFPESVSLQFQSMMLVPLLAAGRRVGILAVFALEGKDAGSFSREEKELFSIIASQTAPPVLMAGMFDRAKAEVKDPFSPFLELLEREYGRASGFSLSLGVVRITLDVGEAEEADRVSALLQESGKALRSAVDEKYTVVRSGAMEFTFLFPGLSPEEQRSCTEKALPQLPDGVSGDAVYSQIPEEFNTPAAYVYRKGFGS